MFNSGDLFQDSHLALQSSSTYCSTVTRVLPSNPVIPENGNGQFWWQSSAFSDIPIPRHLGEAVPPTMVLHLA
jgi:hypothetical protein